MKAKSGNNFAQEFLTMEFLLLGTGTSQGIPVIGCKCEVCESSDPRDQRLRSSLLVRSSTTTVLIDAGPDMRQQLLRAKVDDIQALIITHEHQDHTAGLDEVRAINFLQKHDIPIYCTERVERRLREQYSYIFNNQDYPGIPQIRFERMGTDPFQIGDISFEPLLLLHGALPVHGFRIQDFVYITDANQMSEEVSNQIRGAAVMVINALRHEKHHSHFTLGEALELADRLEIEQLYTTHISHQLGLHAQVEAQLKRGRNLAYDGLSIKM